MEIRDYLRMLRQGWITIVVIMVGVVLLTLAYVGLAPKKYTATATLYITANNARSLTELQTATSYANSAASSYAQIIQSPAVLSPVSAGLNSGPDLSQLTQMTVATVRSDTAIIDVTVTDSDPDDVARIANEVADVASRVVPQLDSNNASGQLIRLIKVQTAIAPTTPDSPNVKRSLAIGIMVGLLLGVSLTITRQSLDNRIRGLDDVPAAEEIPLLASVPRVRHPERRLVIRDEPAGAPAEAFRTLRTNLWLAQPGRRRVLLCAPASDDHDGAFVAVNLAVAIAQSGRQVVLVDLDLRRSPLSLIFEPGTGQGFGDYLDGRAELAEVVRPSGIERLELIGAGRTEGGPAEALESPAMRTGLAKLGEAFEFVVLHAPPVLGFTDASIASRFATDTIVTVSEGRTHGRDLTAALIALRNLKVVPAGFVLTRAGAGTNARSVGVLERSVERHEHLVAPEWD